MTVSIQSSKPNFSSASAVSLPSGCSVDRMRLSDGVDESLAPTELALEHVKDVVTELHSLLEDYAPSWYSERHCIRTEQALHELNQLIASKADIHVS